MKFVHPEILWAFSALSIPILVHLFNFRRFKKVLFPNVSFLREIKQETQSKSKLKHLLILFSRMFAMSCIILAFAQPYVPAPGNDARPGDRAVSIYIDNTFSMDARSESGPLLDLAKNKALEIVNSFGPSDKFQLLTADFLGKHQRLVSKEEMTELIQEVGTSSASPALSAVMARQRDVLNRSGLDNKTSFLISDLQKSEVDESDLKNDSTLAVRLVPTQASLRANVYVDSVWFASPLRQLNQPEQLYVRVRNASDDDHDNLPMTLYINDQQKSVSTVSVKANQAADALITFTNTEPGFKQSRVVIEDYPIIFDDTYFFSYNVAAQIHVLNVHGKGAQDPDPVVSVFGDDPYFTLTSVNEGNVDYGQLPNQQLVVLNQCDELSTGMISELQRFLQNGGSVLMLPSYSGKPETYNQLLTPLTSAAFGALFNSTLKADRINWEHYIYKDAFERPDGNIEMPVVNRFYELQAGARSSLEPMLTLQDGHLFLASAAIGAGRLYVCAAPLRAEDSNFIRHSFFPASLLRMAEFSQSSAPLAYTTGTTEAIVLRNLQMPGESTFRLRNPKGGDEVIPEHRNAGGNVEIFVKDAQLQAGNYELLSGDSLVEVLSFNYPRRESDTEVADVAGLITFANSQGWSNWSVLDGSLDTIARSATEMESGKKYWYSMIVWALIFLAIEILLIKFWR